MSDRASIAGRSVIAVIGMHRSGTSLTMQALGALGASSGGGLLAGNDFNRNGYWEAGEVVAFHDLLLGNLGRRWGMPEHLLPVPDAWWDSPAAQEARREAQTLLANRIGLLEDGAVLALKDPRMTLFLPLWTAAAADLGLFMRVVFCLRHPGEVAASLTRRDRIDPAMGQALWLAYTLAAIEQANTVPMYMSRLADWHLDPLGSLGRIAGFAGLPAGGVEPPFAPELATRISDTDIDDPLVAQWWQDLTALPSGAEFPKSMIENARLLRQGAGQGAVLAAAIRAEIGETSTEVLLRDLESYRSGVNRLSNERDEQAARAIQLQDAYSREAEARAAYQDRAQRFEEAYAIEAKTRAIYEEAYAIEAKARAAYEARLARLNPLRWFRRR